MREIHLFIFNDFIVLAKANTNIPKQIPFDNYKNCFNIYGNVYKLYKIINIKS